MFRPRQYVLLIAFPCLALAGATPEGQPLPNGKRTGPVPMIADALGCGAFESVGGLSNGVDMERHNLNQTIFPEAICNDGTGAIFYFRPAKAAAHRNQWLIQLQGGGGCGNAESCAKRWCSIDTAFSATGMSSNGAPLVAINANGIMDDRPANPLADWNHVLIKYCSSDIWRSASRDVVLETNIGGPLVQYRIHFMGSRIIDATIATLRQDGVTAVSYTLGDTPVPMPDLDDATHVIFAGASAGGGGVTNNADRVRDMLVSNNNQCNAGGCPLQFFAIIDSTFAPDLELLDIASSQLCTDFGACDLQSLIAFATEAYDPIRDQSCVDWHAANDPGTEWMCADPGHIIRHHVTSPMFIQMGQEDKLISSNFINAGYAVPGEGEFDLDLFRETIHDQLHAMAQIQATGHEGGSIPVVPGIFSTRCPEHETLRNNPHIYNSYIAVANQQIRFFDVFANWVSGSGVTRVITPEDGVDFCGGFTHGDCDFNDRVDLVDHAEFSPCLLGPGVEVTSECWCYDADNNRAVDMSDFSRFQANFLPGP